MRRPKGCAIVLGTGATLKGVAENRRRLGLRFLKMELRERFKNYTPAATTSPAARR